MKANYENGKVYKIVNMVDDEIYVGSTCYSLTKRMSMHKRDAQTSKMAKVHVKMRNIGIENFKIILIELYPCSNRDELTMREEEFRVNLRATLNTVSCNTGVPRSVYNLCWSAANYIMNGDQIRIRSKLAYSQNPDKFRERVRTRYANHKEDIKERRKVPYTCDCGSTFRVNDRARHNRSKKHLTFSASKEKA
jgi:hypothetical protein